MPLLYLKNKNILIYLLYFAFCLFIATLEILAYLKPDVPLFSILASRIWFIWSVFSILLSLLIFFKVFLSDILHKNILSLIALFIVTFFVSFNISSFPQNISAESTQELSAGLNNLIKPDLGYTENAFLGYPSRQYIISAFPSLIFGRTILGIRLGFLLPFIIGIFIFYAGIKSYFSYSSHIDENLGLIIMTILSFPIIILLLRIFEQASLSVAYTFWAIGLLFYTLKNPKIHFVLTLIWIISMLSTTYTPSLATWSLLIIFLIYISVKTIIKEKYYFALLWLGCMISSFTIGFNALNHRADAKLAKIDQNQTTTIGKLPEALEYFSFKNTEVWDFSLPFFGPIIAAPIAIYILSSLLFLNGYKHFALNLWIFATLLISVVSPGYALPSVKFGIHRTIVIIPPLLAGITIIIDKYKIGIPRKLFFPIFILLIIYGAYITTVIYQQFNQKVDERSLVLREVLRIIKNQSFPQLDPVQIKNLSSNTDPILSPDHLKYFFPKFNFISDNSSCFNDIDFNQNAIIYIDDICTEELSKYKNQLDIHPFTVNLKDTQKKVKIAINKSYH